MIKFSDLEQMTATIQLAKIKFAVISYISNVTTIKFDRWNKFNLWTIQGLKTISFLKILKYIE